MKKYFRAERNRMKTKRNGVGSMQLTSTDDFESLWDNMVNDAGNVLSPVDASGANNDDLLHAIEDGIPNKDNTENKLVVALNTQDREEDTKTGRGRDNARLNRKCIEGDSADDRSIALPRLAEKRSKPRICINVIENGEGEVDDDASICSKSTDSSTKSSSTTSCTGRNSRTKTSEDLEVDSKKSSGLLSFRARSLNKGTKKKRYFDKYGVSLCSKYDRQIPISSNLNCKGKPKQTNDNMQKSRRFKEENSTSADLWIRRDQNDANDSSDTGSTISYGGSNHSSSTEKGGDFSDYYDSDGELTYEPSLSQDLKDMRADWSYFFDKMFDCICDVGPNRGSKE